MSKALETEERRNKITDVQSLSDKWTGCPMAIFKGLEARLASCVHGVIAFFDGDFVAAVKPWPVGDRFGDISRIRWILECPDPDRLDRLMTELQVKNAIDFPQAAWRSMPKARRMERIMASLERIEPDATVWAALLGKGRLQSKAGFRPKEKVSTERIELIENCLHECGLLYEGK